MIADGRSADVLEVGAARARLGAAGAVALLDAGRAVDQAGGGKVQAPGRS